MGMSKVAAAGLAVLFALVSWIAVMVLSEVDQDRQEQQVESRAANLALMFEEQVFRQVLSIDQTLRLLKLDWERDPAGLDFVALQRRAGALSDVLSQVSLVDARGRVVVGTRGELAGMDLSSQPFFAEHRGSDVFGSLVTGPFQSNGRWYLNISRRLDTPRGAFAGVIVAAYDLDALMRDMSQADLGPRGLIMLVGRNGMVRAISLRGVQSPGADISHSPLFQAMFNDTGTAWTGPSGPDGDVRIHAWRPVPGQDMTLVVGLDRAAALQPSIARRREGMLGAAAITLLVVILAVAVGSMIAAAASREQRLDEDRAVLEAANRQLALARERADEKSVQLGMTLAGMSDGVSMFSAEQTLVQWNHQMAELAGVPSGILQVGVSVEKMLQAQAAAGEFGEGEERAEMVRRMAVFYSGAGPALIELYRPTGMVLELRRTSLPDGGTVTLYSDITARKHAEQAQSRAREQAEVAAQEKSRFVAIVSHEIRTPLNVALNSLSLLDGSTLSASQRHLVETGLLAGESLMGLLNDILDLSRMQAGRLQLRPAPFALRPLLLGVAEMFRYQAEERGVELSVEVAAGVPDQLMADAGRLRQVLMNLVNNAAKFAEPGPASIRASFSILDGARVLRLAVRDCGPPIPDLDRARLFRPFSQLERPGSTGTGLGLAICQLLANLLGGQIGCDAATTGGKEFWLTLPADVVDVPVDAAKPPAMKAALDWLPRTRVLLVEDVVANQMIVAMLLRREGHMVDVAASGMAALAMVASRPYDLVFLDIFMPGIDGLETARRIRRTIGARAKLPLIALTANVSASDRADYIAAGMDDVVAKPVERAALLGALARHVWAGRRAARTIPQQEVPPARPLPAAIDAARLAAWREGLPPSVCATLFDDCVRQLRDRVPPLRTAMQRRDGPAIKQHTHAMAGAAGNYGLAALEDLLRTIGRQPPDSLDADAQSLTVEAEIDRAEQSVQELTQAEAA
jgi:signal transduction histidine kinase/CheY-like chemotaxis protein